jgi:tRNA pseudouridine55 synthase
MADLQAGQIAPSGFLNIYKPAGYTSHDVVAVLRRHLPRKTKVGHTGTLDPQATGILPVCVGKGTRLAEYFHDLPKTYLGELTLGKTTDTYDCWGEVVAEADENAVAAVTEADFLAVLPRFMGRISQVPPMVSAIKIDGKKLYQLARAGVEVERPARQVQIFDLRVREIALPRVTMEVTCSSGTYIRSLFHDIGAALGVGAHMSALERLAVGGFTKENALSLDEAEKMLIAGDFSALLPLELGVQHLPLIELQDERDFDNAIHGREIVLGLSEAEAPACRVFYRGRLVGIGETSYEAQGCACNEMLLLKMDKVLV